ncbi:hypothetical protein [Nocardiopsis lambiniae]|uniref:Uncharacterized protein n=1 Tax=Nocardiopsis lambiniae TaxID=3075539 RepID=A0ABU2MFV0_9ACTN|nr:hypothetical protein [Nocardiopsis sp. DSM 44743]MDT0330756.1 hypothetical protein [Nocardiopsis sp. DSM 44743]
MARYRYLNRSELVAARRPATEVLRLRRPRRASRARMYVTHPGRDLAPLALAVRQLLGHTTTPDPAPMPAAVPAPAANPPQVPAAASDQAPHPVVAPTSAPTPVPASGSGFAAAVASRPRIQALREGTRSRREPVPTTGKAPARLRARTAAFQSTAHLVADRSALWRDELAASRIVAWNLGRAA